mgnify:CR=1 FL=1
MTIAALTESRVQILGDGLTDRVDLPFQFVDQNDLRVIHSDIGGTDTKWIFQQSPGYWYCTGGDYATGTVHFTASDLAAGERLTVVLISNYDQPLTLAGGEIDPAVLERAMDRTALQVQAIAGRVSRSLSIAPSLYGELPDLQVPDLPDGYGFVRQGEKLVPALIESTAISAAVSAAQVAKTAAEAARSEAVGAQAATGTSRALAEAAQDAADTAKTQAQEASDKAEKWAEEDEGTQVEAGQYSAKHHALKSAKSASLAALNATEVLGHGRVPVGFMIPWHGLRAPNQYWVLVDSVGQVFSRSLFPALLDVFAPQFTVTYSAASATVEGINCPQKLKAGWPVEGENIPPGTTILTVDSASQITLSATPNGGGTALRIFPHGNGDGATTASYPSVAGRVVRGLDSMGAVNPDAGNYLGELQADELGEHGHALYGGVVETQNAYSLSSGYGLYGNPNNHANNSYITYTRDDPVRPEYVERVGGSETRVKAIIAPYIVKVADGVDDPAIISAANVVSDLAAAQAALATAQIDIATLQSNMPTFAEFEFTSWANGVWYSMAHGAVSRPTVVFLYAECINANNDYVVGERTLLGMQDRSNNDGSAYNYGAGVSADETAVHWAGGAQSMRIMPRTNGGTMGVSSTDFKMVVVAGWL